VRRRAERREIMQHPTGGTTMRIDDNVPRSCIYNDRRYGYCAGDREARYPHLFRGNAVFLPSNKRWTGSDHSSVSQLKYLYSLEDRVHCKRHKYGSCPRDASRRVVMHGCALVVDIQQCTQLRALSTSIPTPISPYPLHSSFQHVMPFRRSNHFAEWNKTFADGEPAP